MNERLYIFMRSDLASLNPGKAMAQAAHAANQFMFAAEKKIGSLQDAHWGEELNGYARWVDQGKGFGTTIVLDADNYSDILSDLASPLEGTELSFGVVHDPSYPIRDGEKMHLIPLDTCAYFFDYGQVSDRTFIDSFELHK